MLASKCVAAACLPAVCDDVAVRIMSISPSLNSFVDHQAVSSINITFSQVVVPNTGSLDLLRVNDGVIQVFGAGGTLFSSSNGSSRTISAPVSIMQSSRFYQVQAAVGFVTTWTNIPSPNISASEWEFTALGVFENVFCFFLIFCIQDRMARWSFS